MKYLHSQFRSTFRLYTKATWCHCRDNEKGVKPDVYRCKNDSFYCFKNREQNYTVWATWRHRPHNDGDGPHRAHGVGAYALGTHTILCTVLRPTLTTIPRGFNHKFLRAGCPTASKHCRDFVHMPVKDRISPLRVAILQS